MHIPSELGVSPSHAPAALLLAVAVVAVIYGRGWLRLRKLAPALALRTCPTAFWGGLLAVWIATGSPLAAWGHDLLSVHMVQHLLLSAVAAPFLLLGTPTLPLLYGGPRFIRDGWSSRGRSRMVSPWSGALSHPVLCWGVAMVVFVGWHAPALFQWAVRSTTWHAVEQACFLTSGLLFWSPIVQPWPSRARWPQWSQPLYLFLATLPCDALSAFLMFSDRVVYPVYEAAPRPFGWSVLQDQEWAGAIMWLGVTVAYGIPAAVITTRLLSRLEPTVRQPT